MPKPGQQGPKNASRREGGRHPVDLHSHTFVSDGLRSPEELVTFAASRGVRTLAVTDHDAVDGIAPAQAAARALELRIIPGVEISCDHRGKEVHLLGLGIDPESSPLDHLLREAQASRRKAFGRALERLETCGVPLPEELLESLSGTRSLGRAHLGRALHEAGHTRTVGEAFARFLGEGRPARVHRDRPSIETAIATVVEAGGLPVLAHPGGYPGAAFDLERIREIASLGVVGIEAHHPVHKARRTKTYLEIAKTLSLLVSGGTDHHGYPGDRPPGSLGLSEAEFAPLAARLSAIAPAGVSS